MTRLVVHIVRHGETQENRKGILQGHLDTELNVQGIGQVALVAEALQDTPFNAAFTSDLKRAKSTAQKILEFHPDVQLQESEEIRERFMGTLQGSRYTKETRRALMNDETVETRELFKERALNWWRATILPLTSDQTQSPLNILVVSHGGFINTLLHALFDKGHLTSKTHTAPLSKCLNTSIATVELNSAEEPAVLAKWGNVSHLLKPSVKEAVQDNVDEVEVDSKVDNE